MRSRGKGIAISYVYTICNTVIGLFMSAFILRRLGKTDYGVYQTMSSFITYLGMFELGTGTIMTRNISLCRKDGSEDEAIQKNISTVWTVTVILSLIILIVSTVFFFSIDSIYKSSLSDYQRSYGKLIFVICVLKLVLSFYTQTMNGVLLGFEHYSRQSLVSLTYLLVRTSIVIVVLSVHPSSVMLVTIDTILTVGTFLYTFVYCQKSFEIRFTFAYFDFAIFKLILPLALAMFLQTIVNMANNNVDKFVIGVAMTPEAVSVYSIGMYIFSTFSSLTTIPISMYMPQIATDMRDGKQGMELTNSLIQPSRLIVLIGGAVLFGFITIGKPFIAIVYGEEYLPAWTIAVIVMIPMFINMTNGVLVNVLDVLRKRHVRSICLGITAVGNIILTVWWIKTWGMVGAATATAICTFIGQIILMNIFYSRSIHIAVMHLFAEAYKGLLPGLILACVTGSITSHRFGNQFAQFFAGGIVFCAVLLASIFAFKSNTAEKQLVIKVLKRSSPKV